MDEVVDPVFVKVRTTVLVLEDVVDVDLVCSIVFVPVTDAVLVTVRLVVADIEEDPVDVLD